jgi:hypothetical protein
VRPAERRQEIIKSHLVRDVNRRHTETPFVLVTAKQIVIASSYVEQVTGRDPRRVVIVRGESGWKRPCFADP